MNTTKFTLTVLIGLRFHGRNLARAPLPLHPACTLYVRLTPCHRDRGVATLVSHVDTSAANTAAPSAITPRIL
jgi:hypothetical protein